MKGPGDGMGPHPSTLGATTLPRPAFLRTWHRRPGEGKAQEVAEEEKEEEEDEEEEEEQGEEEEEEEKEEEEKEENGGS